MNRVFVLLGSLWMGLGLVGCETLDQISSSLGKTKVSYTLKNGEKVEGTLLHDADGKALVQVKYGAVTVSTGDVENVEKHGEAEEPLPGSGRLAKWDRCLHVLNSRPWAAKLAQVPATVIEKGIMKHVPYLSFRSGAYEFNVYGDPEKPACVEIGFYAKNVPEADRKECLNTMLLVLNDTGDRQALRSANLDKSLGQFKGMSVEVTPSGADDAFGAWWISVYDEEELNQQRASPNELSKITVTHTEIKKLAAGGASSAVAGGSKPSPSVYAWGEHDLKDTRPQRANSPGEERIYVKGVYRKNGVYVVWKS